ncbi:MAG: glycosyltransferase family 4 protein [Candidatus Falkowbacteria bacterium]
MKILMLTSRFGSGYGMGYSAYKEAKCFADFNHEVTLVHLNSDIDNYLDNRIKFIHLSIKKTHLIDFIFLYFTLKNFLKTQININNFDVIYIQSLEFGLLKLSKIKKPIFYFSRSSMVGLQNALRKERIHKTFLSQINHIILVRLEKRCMKYAKIVFVKSRNMASEVANLYNINSKKISVITGGIDEKDYKTDSIKFCEKFRKKLLISPTAKIILYAGRIVPQKGLIYLIKASLQLLKNYNFVVVVAGSRIDEIYSDSIMKLLNNSEYRKSFYFLGHINQLKMSSIFNIADCVVTSSLYEPFGMVNLQAAFLGKNIITTDITGSIDILRDYHNIKIIKSGSVEDAKTSLEEMLLSSKNKNNKQFDFSKYSWINVAKKILNLFQKEV